MTPIHNEMRLRYKTDNDRMVIAPGSDVGASLARWLPPWSVRFSDKKE